MAKEARLVVEKREKLGSAECRRLRSRGLIPGSVYGHGMDPVPVRVSEEILRPIVQSGTHVVDVELDGETEKAIIREVQWDYLGSQIQHFDLMRVSRDERVHLHVPVELKGTAPGALGGSGVLEQPVHEVEIECPATQIPDSLVARIGSLEVGQALHVRDLEIPDGVKVLTPADIVVVHVVQVSHEVPLAAEAAPAEPEVIGRKKPEEGEASA